MLRQGKVYLVLIIALTITLGPILYAAHSNTDGVIPEDSTVGRQRAMNYLISFAFLIGVGVAGGSVVFSNRATRKLNRILGELLSEKATSLSMMERILHTMDVYIYVTEFETDKIIFINDSMSKDFGLTGSVKGEICWKVFQSGFDKRCDFCPKHKLKTAPDKPVHWEGYNMITGKRYKNIDRIIDWPDGTKVHLQQSEDVTELKDALAMAKRFKQQTLMAEISRSFL